MIRRLDNASTALGAALRPPRGAATVRWLERRGSRTPNITLASVPLDLLRPDAGTIRLFGRPSSDAPARAAVSFLPELFRPSALLTGWDFVITSYSIHYTKLYDCVLGFVF